MSSRQGATDFLWLRPAGAWRAWRTLGLPRGLLLQLRFGVLARWTGRPPPPFDHGVSLGSSPAEELAWWEGEVQRLHDLGVLLEIPPSRARWVSRIFLVPKKTGIWRTVIDLRHINTFAPQGTAEVETLRRLPSVLRPGDFMVSLDLSDGYYHFRLAARHQRYFQFRVGSRAFQLVGLNMGWSLSPGIFTDFLRTVVLHLRQKGIRLLWYLDDFLLAAPTPEETAAARDYVTNLFLQLGLTVKPEKCVWEPTQRLRHLGLVIDTDLGVYLVDEQKTLKVRGLARALLSAAAGSCRSVRKRELAGFVGLAQFLLPAVPQARFYLRSLHDAMGTLQGWSGRVQLSHQARRDLRWWTSFDGTSFHGGPIWKPATTAVLSTDASDFGWGGALHAPVHLQARGFWTTEERLLHITAKELLAIVRTLETHAAVLRGHRVRLLCDNQAVVAVVNHGTSRSPVLMDCLRQLHRITDFFAIGLQLEYIRSEHNVEADGLSREQDEEDWRLHPSLFEQIGGPRCTVDRFASATNSMLPRFNSRWPCPGSEAVDALSLPDEDWQAELNYCNPPWTLLEQLGQRLLNSGAQALVVMPAWRHTIVYQLYRSMASRVTHLGRWAGMFQPGRPVARVLAPRWDVDVFHIPRRAPQTLFGSDSPGLSWLLGL